MNEQNLKSWKPGQSGNPFGRRLKSPEERTAEALAREHTPEAIAALVAIAKSKRANARARVAAAVALLDRGWGKTTQTSNVNVRSRTLLELSDDELIAIITAEEGAAAEETAAGEPEPVH